MQVWEVGFEQEKEESLNVGALLEIWEMCYQAEVTVDRPHLLPK